jgi:hypothetical protein
MLSNDNDKAIHTAASLQHTRQGVTPPVCTAAGAETPLNNPNCPSTRASKKMAIHVDATTAKVTTTTHHKKANPALEHPATVDGKKDKDTPTLMQLECPPEVKTQLDSTTEVTQPKHCCGSRILQCLKHNSMVPLMLHILYHGSRRLQRLIRCSMPPHHS